MQSTLQEISLYLVDSLVLNAAVMWMFSFGAYVRVRRSKSNATTTVIGCQTARGSEFHCANLAGAFEDWMKRFQRYIDISGEYVE
jgi:hypothetical protein